QGDTIPFLARYRKDVTGGLDETQLEAIEERRQYFLNLAQRQIYVLETIARQGKLDEALRQSIESCFDRTALEDLYVPFKKRRRTKATAAREHGLTPLAEYIWKQKDGGKSLEELAAAHVMPDSEVTTPALALEGAQHILAEDLSLNVESRTAVRNCMLTDGCITTVPTKKTEGQKTKYEAYYSFSEPVKSIPSHRFLAVQRGVSEGYLRLELAFDDEKLIEELVGHCLTAPGTPFEPLIRATVIDAYNRLLRPSIETEVIRMLHDRAEAEAIHVFRANAESLLLAPPAGSIPVIGMDPGLRTGCKLAVVDGTGAFVESGVIFPNPPQNDIDGAKEVLKSLIQRHKVRALAIGNGTGSRETSSFVRQALKELEHDAPLCVLVNESGASIYSASKVAREEFPELDVTIRGAISIARRLQDPLAELVKIEPRHVGVGQYQHDVNQRSLREGLHKTVVSCVNQVGVELNTASIALLRYISGLNANTAKSIVERRAKHGVYKDRQELLEVEGVGPKT
ncbi:MAG: helix-hairpin-helix domain-containing protein, partial [Candidatus Hydrogenedentes bacterium]|nr:helix-hairpin-helix domain-containing protein [Candidatus Hydrogenedentota bacterium]